MANEIAYDLTIHPDDIPRLPTRLRKKVEENLYAYEILVTFESETATTGFHTQIPNLHGLASGRSYKWCQWVGHDRLILEIGFDDHDRDFFDAIRVKFENLVQVGFQVIFRALALVFLDPAKANISGERAKIKLIHRKQFILRRNLF
jgi:hypothetical protein